MTMRCAVLVLVVGVALSGCATPSQPALVIGKTPGSDVVALTEGGLQTAIDRLPARIETVMKKSGVPGMAVAVVQGDKVVFSEGYGVRKKGSNEQVDTHTVFQLASVSKSLAATVAAAGVSTGAFSWDDPATKYLPEFALSDPSVTKSVTIGDLYAHRSGLPLAIGDDLEDLGYSRAEVIDRLRFAPLDSFRTSYHYANFGITTGAEAAAAASGMTWEDLSDETLYKPIKMSSTSSRHDDFLNQENRAELHIWQGKKSFAPTAERDPDPQSPAGGVSSNVVDLASWMSLLLSTVNDGDNSVLKKDALLPALSPQAFSAQPADISTRAGFYGYGFNVTVGAAGRPELGHSGAFVLGAATNFKLIPSANVGIIVLTNGGPIGAAETITSEFSDLVQYGQFTRDWWNTWFDRMSGYYKPEGELAGLARPQSPAAARSSDAYVGEYQNDYFGPARIEKDGSDLTIALGPDGRVSHPLTHWDDDTFTFMLEGENAPKGTVAKVVFAGDRPQAPSVTIDFYDGNGLGTWSRR